VYNTLLFHYYRFQKRKKPPAWFRFASSVVGLIYIIPMAIEIYAKLINPTDFSTSEIGNLLISVKALIFALTYVTIFVLELSMKLYNITETSEKMGKLSCFWFFLAFFLSV
jgi:hypothetical protein